MVFEKIKISNILRIRGYKYFADAKVNKIFITNLKIAMVYAYYCKSKEVLVFTDNMYKHSIRVVTSNSDEKVSIPKDIRDIISSVGYEKEVMFIHNHPNNSSFSVLDVLTFLNLSAIKYLVVITNSCQYVAILEKTAGIPFQIQLNWIKYIRYLMVKDNLTYHSTARHIIDEMVNHNVARYKEFKMY